MNPTPEDLKARRDGKVLLFLAVGALSGILLWYGSVLLRRHETLLGIAAIAFSALFWYPLFRLGRYHARRRHDP